MSLVLQTAWALAPRLDRWIQDGVLQLQRRAYEAQSEATWTDLDKDLPLTTFEEKLSDLPTESLPPIVCKCEKHLYEARANEKKHAVLSSIQQSNFQEELSIRARFPWITIQLRTVDKMFKTVETTLKWTQQTWIITQSSEV